MAQERLTGLFAERYLIEQELGHGASSVVYLAQDRKHDRQIALKVLSKDLAHTLGPERFLREIHVTSRLHHPHVLPIYDSGEWNGLLYYVLPYVRGESLRGKMDREKQLPIEECVRITCEVADALAHAHAQGVIHRDVKPDNIMLSDGHALLADFGIARAVDVHTGERLTSSGLIVGTSAYMSPEQASGEEKIDARSDIYSLACVTYEMIAGVQPFIGPSTQAVIAQRFKHSPRPVSTYRPTVPEYLEHALDKALAVSPADRFQSVKEFAAELPDVPNATRDRRVSLLRRTVYSRQKAFGFAAAALAAITVAFVAANPPGNVRSLFFAHTALDSTKFAVVPFSNSGLIDRADLDAAIALHRSLEGWKGISLVDRAVISDAVAKQPAMQIGDALDLARKFGAGRLVRVDSALDVTLYDVESRSPLNEISAEDVKGAAEPHATAVMALLRVHDRPSAADGGDGRTKSLPAWRAYGAGHVALSRWNVAEAKQDFQRAARLDPAFAPAWLWSAVVTQWTSEKADTAEWTDYALHAVNNASRLAGRDRALALALMALARGDYPAACAHYRSLTVSDSTDFAAWYGLGECQYLDEEVLASAASPSSWRFRSSYDAAFKAYARAIKFEPGIYAVMSFEKMQRLLPVTTNLVRGTKANRFAAYPSLDHDILAFIPYPMAIFASPPASATATQVRALERNLRLLSSLVGGWVRALPNSANAREALADVLETRGDIARTGSGSQSASDAVADALRLSRDSIQRMRLTATEVRLRVKRGEFANARALADSLLGSSSRGDSLSAAQLLGVAALTGRISLAAQFAGATRTTPNWVGLTRVPPPVREVAGNLLAHAALGDCGPATTRLQALLEDRLQGYVSEADRDAIRASLLERTLPMLGPCTAGRAALKIAQPKGRLSRMQQAFARNDRPALKALFDTLAVERRSKRAGDLTFDQTYQEAWLKVASGDTAGGVQQLDRAFTALSTLSASSFRDIGVPGALAQAMVFRADLADARREKITARKFARWAADLWAHADAELQPVVARMKRMAAGPN